MHSETNLAIKLGLTSWCGLEIVNIRIDNNGDKNNALPCPNCLNNIINILQPKRVFYTDARKGWSSLIC
jgi:hypothetical protein